MKGKSNLKPGSKKGMKEAARKRREEIARLVRQVGFWNLTTANLANEYGVSRTTILKDLEILKKELKPTEIQEVEFHLDTALRGATEELIKTIKASPQATLRDKAQAAQALERIAARYTDFLERYGRKEQIAEKHEHVVNFQEELQEVVKRVNQKKEKKK
jgi:DNA-binding transcriptional MocR family regulator